MEAAKQAAFLGILIKDNASSRLTRPRNRAEGLARIENARFYLFTLLLAKHLCSLQVYSGNHTSGCPMVKKSLSKKPS